MWICHIRWEEMSFPVYILRATVVLCSHPLLPTSRKFFSFFLLFKAGQFTALNKIGIMLVTTKRMDIGLASTCDTNAETGHHRC
jgi:hypothetical protein